MHGFECIPPNLTEIVKAQREAMQQRALRRADEWRSGRVEVAFVKAAAVDIAPATGSAAWCQQLAVLKSAHTHDNAVSREAKAVLMFTQAEAAAAHRRSAWRNVVDRKQNCDALYVRAVF